MTNADCIRRMTDEQLYDFLSEWECGDIDYSITFCDLCKQGGNELNLDCDGCRKHWLQRDAVDFGGLLYWKRNTTFTADTPQTETQTKTQNSNLTFEKDECAKEYEELGLKELKELIDADRKTEPSSSEIPNNCEVSEIPTGSIISKMEQVDKDINVRSKDEPQTERKNLCGKQICDHLFDDDCALKTDCAWK